ncbi:unnamed protein product [marine sediment metagenome]|uniref:Uncharacterized protein n=1 Tax=marine sediment metagenome TaxID=412755 RepID=X0TXJ2_9ZZZZ
METFTFTFKPDRTSPETKQQRFKSNCFFGAATRFLTFTTARYPDFILTQIQDQHGAELYDTGLRPEKLA